MADFIEKKFIKYHLGSKQIRCHLDAVHACPPKADEFTGEIVEGVVDKIGCSGIVAIVSRLKADINRPRDNKNKDAIDEYRWALTSILENIDILDDKKKLLKPYLHLAIHGMKDSYQEDIEIGTLRGQTCTPGIRDWFVGEMQKQIKNLHIDERFPGDPSKLVFRDGDKASDLSYLGYGRNYNIIQIEISRRLRKNYQMALVSILGDMIFRFNEKF